MDPSRPQPRLTEQSFAEGLNALKRRDRKLAFVLSQYGDPPLWAREPGFATLIHIILEQQVSLSSAKAAFDRLQEAANPLTPERILQFDDATLKEIGFSRQKAGYARSQAEAILDGDLNLEDLEIMEDGTARSELIKVKGIGPWTADIYLLMALRRPDVWPHGDLALVKAYQGLAGLPAAPTQEALRLTANHWSPWKAVAARILWHYYLSK